MDSLKAENSQLKEENLKLERSTEEVVNAGLENFLYQFEFTPDYENLQSFFINYGTRQIFAEIKEMHLSLDLSMVEVNYSTLEEARDEAAQSSPEAYGRTLAFSFL
ncbi:hypothetical protein Fot_32758 [Forsythia ovata]|uniref:Uncharacterized protein n=1 Tax=Forsythia ovata TaxID=205694 RepID=A0ABD1T8Y3_9LAMI